MFFAASGLFAQTKSYVGVGVDENEKQSDVAIFEIKSDGERGVILPVVESARKYEDLINSSTSGLVLIANDRLVFLDTEGESKVLSDFIQPVPNLDYLAFKMVDSSQDPIELKPIDEAGEFVKETRINVPPSLRQRNFVMAIDNNTGESNWIELESLLNELNVQMSGNNGPKETSEDYERVIEEQNKKIEALEAELKLIKEKLGL
ncbi:hypothetical protein HNQ88_004767 [Aureibacter tunicatorum]|uniref:Uncharacterized protein n=2 Tax=Aureibacter tunicatorum TaxID=866807 RepID=A0AAE3XTE6_9BACT|nr:hypothetical protein [Aureibacter tunicatorum]